MHSPFDLSSLLLWLISGGAAIVAGALVSFVYERSEKFQSLGTTGKVTAVFVATSVVSVVAMVLRDKLAPGTLEALNPYVVLLITAFHQAGAFAASQIAHDRDPLAISRRNAGEVKLERIIL